MPQHPARHHAPAHQREPCAGREVEREIPRHPYDRAGELIPRASDLAFGRALLLCNKALLSAAALIGRGHPEDAGAVTRRAIEIATTSLAIKYDPRNLDRWLAEKEREARRLARSKGERPTPIDSSRIRWPCKHKLLDSLRMEQGLLSDIYVHFTPEYTGRQYWQQEPQGHIVTHYLPYHCPDDMVTRQQFILLTGFHMKMLGLLDECYDQAFSRDEMWRGIYRATDAARVTLSKAFLRDRQAAGGGTDAP